MPLNERKYLNKSQQESSNKEATTEEDNDSSPHSFFSKLKHAILFEHDKKQHGQLRNMFDVYKPSLVDDCISQVLNEVFGDKVIIESIRQRVANKINKL